MSLNPTSSHELVLYKHGWVAARLLAVAAHHEARCLSRLGLDLGFLGGSFSPLRSVTPTSGSISFIHKGFSDSTLPHYSHPTINRKKSPKTIMWSHNQVGKAATERSQWVFLLTFSHCLEKLISRSHLLGITTQYFICHPHTNPMFCCSTASSAPALHWDPTSSEHNGNPGWRIQGAAISTRFLEYSDSFYHKPAGLQVVAHRGLQWNHLLRVVREHTQALQLLHSKSNTLHK